MMKKILPFSLIFLSLLGYFIVGACLPEMPSLKGYLCQNDEECAPYFKCIQGRCGIPDAGEKLFREPIVRRERPIIEEKTIPEKPIERIPEKQTTKEKFICQPGAERPCYTGDRRKIGQGPCKEGVNVCTETGHWGAACVGQVIPQKEVCNGKDDDCDGNIDNVEGIGKPCQFENKLGICKVGKWVCGKNNKVCQPLFTKKLEICNGKDDDCDGQLDEGCSLPQIKNRIASIVGGHSSNSVILGARYKDKQILFVSDYAKDDDGSLRIYLIDTKNKKRVGTPKIFAKVALKFIRHPDKAQFILMGPFKDRNNKKIIKYLKYDLASFSPEKIDIAPLASFEGEILLMDTDPAGNYLFVVTKDKTGQCLLHATPIKKIINASQPPSTPVNSFLTLTHCPNVMAMGPPKSQILVLGVDQNGNRNAYVTVIKFSSQRTSFFLKSKAKYIDPYLVTISTLAFSEDARYVVGMGMREGQLGFFFQWDLKNNKGNSNSVIAVEQLDKVYGVNISSPAIFLVSPYYRYLVFGGKNLQTPSEKFIYFKEIGRNGSASLKKIPHPIEVTSMDWKNDIFVYAVKKNIYVVSSKQQP